MNIEAIRSLLLTVESGSFSAASEQLGVPPSTVSRRVSELEGDLGQTILVRTGRGVRLVDEATPTLLRLRDVLLAVDACYLPPAPMTRLRVTTTVEMSVSLLPGLLPAFREEFPEVVVEIRGKDRALGLIEEDFDLAVRAGVLSDSTYLSRKLPSNAFVVVAAPAMAAKNPVTERACLNPRRRNRGPSSRALGALEAEALPRPLTRGREARHLHRGAADCARRSSLCGDASPRRR